MLDATAKLPLKDPDLFRQANYIDGQWVQADSGKTLAVRNPATGEVIGHVPAMSAAETRRAIEAANAAWPAWRAMLAKERGAILRRLNDLMLANADDLAAIMTAEQGKPLTEAKGEVVYSASFIEWFAEEAKRVYGETIPQNAKGRRILVTKEPIGVFAAITPWNFPSAMITRKAGPGWAAGCTGVIRPASQTPFSALAIAVLAERAGMPKGVCNVITGPSGETGKELTSNPIIRKLSFTGSTEVGRVLLAQCAETIKKTSMELGGNAPFIVFDDADLDQAALGAVAGIFGAAGQTCMAGSRLLVQEGIHDAFVEKVSAIAGKARIGDPSKMETEIGPIATRPQFEKILGMIEMARAEGARCVLGGHALAGEGFGQGQFVAPTIFVDVANHMRIAREEVFGPVLSVLRFRDEEEAIRIANDTPYGLAAGIWTQDLRRSLFCVDRLRAGTVWVNNYRATSFAMPFGGYKASGIGREGGVDAIKDYMQTKSVWITPSPNRANPFVLG